MSARSVFTLSAVLVLTSFAFSAGEKVDFSGIWILNRDKTDLSDVDLYLAKITIVQKGDSLLTMRTYINRDGEEYPFGEKLTLDGAEHEIVIYEMPRKSAAQWSDDAKSILIASSVFYYADGGEEEFEISEKLTLDETGKVLLIDYAGRSPRGEQKMVFTYDRLVSE